MSKKIAIPSIIAVALVVVAILWEGLYPDKYDPKNIQYVLWKWHLVGIDLDRAVSVMQHDSWPERMILGKSEEQLRKEVWVLGASRGGPAVLSLCQPGSCSARR